MATENPKNQAILMAVLTQARRCFYHEGRKERMANQVNRINSEKLNLRAGGYSGYFGPKTRMQIVVNKMRGPP